MFSRFAVYLGVAFFLFVFSVFFSGDVMGEGSFYGCTCPKGYTTYSYQVMMLGVYIRPNLAVTCVANGEMKKECPKGSGYDESLGLCYSPLPDNGECPLGTERALYKDQCIGERPELISCPPGGQYDAVTGFCVAPCEESKPQSSESSGEEY